MKRILVLVLVFVFVLVFVPSALGQQMFLTSDPSSQQVDLWKIVLEDGTVIDGLNQDYCVWWEITDLPVGVYTGEAFFGASEWVLTTETGVQKTGNVWSAGTPFSLERKQLDFENAVLKLGERQAEN